MEVLADWVNQYVICLKHFKLFVTLRESGKRLSSAEMARFSKIFRKLGEGFLLFATIVKRIRFNSDVRNTPLFQREK
ncbi:hypothetical protein H6F87_02760 [Cyanobacteria bacterium FACHB-502]|nr:hypothetical protein [Cyanobacteria bacterium FACHB-502]